MCRCLGHFAAVSSSDDGKGIGFELVGGQSSCYEFGGLSIYHLDITAGVIVVAAVN